LDKKYQIATARLALYAPSLAEVRLLIQGKRKQVGTRLQIDVLEEWWNGPSLIRLLPKLLNEMEQYRAEDLRWIWLVIDPQTAQVIGDIGFHHPILGETAEIGYSVIPAVRGQGYTPEATLSIIYWAFDHTAIKRVIAQIEPQNEASLRVAAKIHMHEVPPLSEMYRCFEFTPSQRIDH
jgi:[ribosomal protein S5]-alanine N-acetyltransferase